jgi:hypothetical protein
MACRNDEVEEFMELRKVSKTLTYAVVTMRILVAGMMVSVAVAANMTRAFAQGEAPPETTASPSEAAPADSSLPPDVPPKLWAAPSVRRALKLHLLELQGGQFNGAQPASRLDLAQAAGGVLEKVGRAPASATPAHDVTPAVAAKYAGIAVSAGVLRLKKAGLASHSQLTKDELAPALSRLVAVINKEPETLVGDPVELNDVAPDSPLYVPIQRCVKAKLISLTANKYEGYGLVPRYQLAAIMVRLADQKRGGKSRHSAAASAAPAKSEP